VTTALPRRRPGRPAGGEHVADREIVLDAAERAIRREGPNVSLDAIAAEAGITKPIVYARVGGRTDLADALSDRLVERIMTAIADAVSTAPEGRAGMAAFVAAHLATVAADRNVYLYVTGGTSAETPHRTVAVAARSAGPLAEQLATWRSAQGHDPRVALPWAYAIIGMLHLVVLWWISAPDRPADELAEQLTDLLWTGLAGTDPR
jgi:AcrR family transcriptional regulator